MNELKIFQNESFGQVRTVEENGKVYFVGIDIARSLGYKDPNSAISRHCKGSVKHPVPTTSGTQEMNVIPEGDIFRLAAKSELPGAEKFESWIFDEVLPSIRKTGSYTVPMSPELQAIIMLDQKQQVIESRIEVLENTSTIDYGQQRNINTIAKKRVINVIGGTDKPAYADRSVSRKIFNALWKDYKDYFNVNSYINTPKVDYQKAIDFIGEWKPQGKLLREIEDCNNQISISA